MSILVRRNPIGFIFGVCLCVTLVVLVKARRGEEHPPGSDDTATPPAAPESKTVTILPDGTARTVENTTTAPSTPTSTTTATAATRNDTTTGVPTIELPPLPVPGGYSGLEPHISNTTVHFHYDKHQAGYVTRLNALLASKTALLQPPAHTASSALADAETFVVPGPSVSAVAAVLANYDPVRLQSRAEESEDEARKRSLPAQATVVYNMAAQIYNHALYFNGLRSPPAAGGGDGGLPTSHPLASLVTYQFGSVDAMMQRLAAAATSHFGSGWAWLIANRSVADGRGAGGQRWAEDIDEIRLDVIGTHDAFTPLQYRVLSVAEEAAREKDLLASGAHDITEACRTAGGRTIQWTVWPLLVVDVWEHAYYLDYRNDRPRYVTAWSKLIDWDKVADMLTHGGPEKRAKATSRSHALVRRYPKF